MLQRWMDPLWWLVEYATGFYRTRKEALGLRGFEAMAFIIKRFYKEEWQGDCPPLKALLEIMANGTWNGKSAHDPEFRAMFNRESVLQSDWYQARLVAKQRVDIRLAKAKLEALEGYCAQAEHLPVVERLSSHEYLLSLNGSIGVDPVLVG